MAPPQPAASPLPASPVESQAESQNPLRASISTEQASRASGPAPAIDAEPVGGGGDASAALFDALYADGNRPGGVEQCAVLAEGQHAAPGLGGYCPVMLVDHDRWDVGSPQWRVAFQGKTYLTSGPEAQQRFQANPNRYCPALDGADPVLVADQNRVVPGQLRFSMVYGGRLYLFADASTHDRFARQPAHYLAAVRSLSQR
jgi:YHS domain-containing protein